MICSECGANADGVDAVPRAADQVMMSGAAVPMEATVVMRAPTDPLRCRRCGGQLKQRADDNVAVVLERLRVYHQNTEPLVEYYRRRPTFRAVNGAQSPEAVAEALAAAIESAGRSRSGAR